MSIPIHATAGNAMSGGAMSGGSMSGGALGAAAPLLTVRGLCFAYGGRAVLSDFALTVEPGEIVGLLGPNGCGKSTALSVICGLRRAPGAVLLQGRYPVHSRGYRSRIGVVFQSPSLDKKLSATENLTLTGRMHGLSGRTLAARVPSLIEWAGLSSRAGDLVGTFSGGMLRRLEIARALVHSPPLLLLDEPTTGLDATSFERTWSRLADLRAQRQTGMIVATHNPAEAERCDRLLIMDGGRVVRAATPSALKRQVARDLVIIESPDPAALHAAIRAANAADADAISTLDPRTLSVASDHGAQSLAAIARAVPETLIARLELRPATLADVFMAITGAALDAELPLSSETSQGSETASDAKRSQDSRPESPQ